MNTINIFIESNVTSVFSRVRSTSEDVNVFITRNERFYGLHSLKKSKFSFYFIVYTSMRALTS